MKRLISLILLLQFCLKAYSYNIDFFSKFNDDYLTKYIQEALIYNHDLKKSLEVTKQFKYEINVKLANEFPNLSVSSNYLGTHFPNDDMNFFKQKSSFILPFKVSWEPDFLLKTKDKISSQKYLYKAQLANQNAIYITLLVDLASTYINILLYDYLIEKEDEIIKIKEKNLYSYTNKYKSGTIDLESYNNSKEELNNKKITYESLIKKRKSALNNFALLLGKSAEESDKFQRGKLENFEFQEEIPKTINSDLIYFRPDIIEIENKLKSAKIDITIAKKDFFPSFNISGLLAFDTSGAGNFFSWGSSFAYLVAGMTQDIFKGGLKIANLKIKKAKYSQMFEEYLQADLNAIREINDTLQIIDKDTKNEKILTNQLDLKTKDYQSSFKKYKAGVNSKIKFLNDKNNLLEQQQLYATAKTIRLVDYFTLYKALGGQL